MATYLPPSPSATPTWRRKTRYHHRDLLQSALRRAREVVAAWGPSALTLRGLARDLGVTAAALVYHFGNLEGLRVAVAEAVLDELLVETNLGHDAPGVPLKQSVDAFVAFAAKSPGLYRLVCGEPWHELQARPSPYHGFRATRSPRYALELWLARRRRRQDRPRVRHLASMVHGLALAQIDGMPPNEVAGALAHAVARMG